MRHALQLPSGASVIDPDASLQVTDHWWWERIGARVRRLLGRYVVGLRLSFNVATAYLPWELIDQPDPVVRVSENQAALGFDPREVISIDGKLAVITLPHATVQADSVSLISLN